MDETSVAGRRQRELLYSTMGMYYLPEDQFGNMCQGRRNVHRKDRFTSLSQGKDHPEPVKT